MKTINNITYNFELLAQEFESAKQLLISMGASGSAVVVGANNAIKVKLGIDCLELTGVDPEDMSTMPNLIDLVHVERFIFHCCIIDYEAKIPRAWINSAYKDFCRMMNISAMNKINFIRSFSKKFQVIRSHGTNWYKGVTLRPSIINQIKETEEATA